MPEITTLVFMRRVKSRILFEQMLGRATRTCDKFVKDHFEIYDPVGVYESLEPVSTMKPVVVNPTVTFTQLLDGLEVIEEENQVRNQVNQIIAKLQRKKRDMDHHTLEQFTEMSGGMEPSEFIADVEEQEPGAAKERLLKHYEMFRMLQESKGKRARSVVVSTDADKLISHERGYGEHESRRPEDYLDEFSDYIRTNLNEIADAG